MLNPKGIDLKLAKTDIKAELKTVNVDLVGINEFVEALTALLLLAEVTEDVMADGKISLADLGSGVKLLTNANVLIEGFKGISEIPAELADINDEELKQVEAVIAKSELKTISADRLKLIIDGLYKLKVGIFG